jgi:hypothetical protein
MIDVDKFTQSFLAIRGRAFRFVNHRWWVYDDGYWTQKQARSSLDRSILAEGRDTEPGTEVNNLIRQGVEQSYIRNRIIAHLAGVLWTDKLPARLEPPS